MPHNPGITNTKFNLHFGLNRIKRSYLVFITLNSGRKIRLFLMVK